MRNKKLIILIIGALIIFSISSFAQTKKLKRIGLYTLCQCKGEIPTAEVMKSIVERYAGDIKYGFELVGYGDLYLSFMDQIRDALLIEKALPVGEKIMWMLYRSRGRVKTVENLEWAGKQPLGVFSFFVLKNDRVYEFIMPKPCGNVALRRTGTSEEYSRELRDLGKIVVPDAICGITVTPQKANISDPISVDMSSSQYAKSMKVEVFDSSGTKVAEQVLSPDAPKWQTAFDKPGDYTFKAIAFNEELKPSQNLCETKIHINYPPECKLFIDCLPCEHLVGKPLTLDASGSSDSDGYITRSDFEILDEAGNVVDKMAVTQQPFSWETLINKAGKYTVTVVVTDDFGAVSEPCALGEAPNWLIIFEKRFHLFIDAGGLASLSVQPGWFGAVRAGLLYEIVPKTLDFVLSGGGAYNITKDFRGNDWKPFGMASALLNYHVGPAYLGGGIGISSKVRSDRNADAEVVGNMGIDVLKSLSLFGELRYRIGKKTQFTKQSKAIIAGLRFLF